MTDRFELLEQVGKGGMGTVWKARDGESGEIVALKLLYPHLAEEPEYVQRMQREVEIASRINSPYAVRVFGYGVREGAPYMAMEFVDGPSLRDQLRRTGKPIAWNGPSGAKNLARDVTRALMAAHAAGVIHRDLKPSNILLPPNGPAKLADFGISRALDLTRLTGTSTMLGTPAYMAPEGGRDARSDLYSLGVVLYEALTGIPPFSGESSGEVMYQHRESAADLSRIPDGEARSVVRWLMEKRPERRPQSAQQLAAVLDGTGTMPMRMPAVSAGARVGVVGAVLMVPLLAAGIWFFASTGSGDHSAAAPSPAATTSEQITSPPTPATSDSHVASSPTSGGPRNGGQTPPIVAGGTSGNSTPAPTPTPSRTTASGGGAIPSPTPGRSPSPAPTATWTPTPTATWTPTPTFTPTPTPTATPTATSTPTPRPQSYYLNVGLDKSSYQPGDPVTFCYSINPQIPFEFRFYKSVDGGPKELLLDWGDDGRGDCATGTMGTSGQREYTFEAWSNGQLLSRRILHITVGNGTVFFAFQ